jgi:fructose-1,6-bisphosphatase/inositol monophosphatase family enzyme
MAASLQRSLKSTFPAGGGEEKVAIGADGDHTREIDRFAEDAILGMIRDHGYDWNIYSEEAGALDHDGDLTLIIDPIDGTHNAINGIPFYSTSMALMETRSGIVKEAVVMNLATGQMYHATRGEGAYRDGIKIFSRELDLDEAVVSSYIGPEAKKWAHELMNWPMRTRYFGSISLEVCLVASGSLDMFVMFGRIPRLTDIAASTLILQEAGGGSFIMDLDGRIGKFNPSFNRELTKAYFSMGDVNSLGKVLEVSKLDHELKEELK